MALKVGYIPEHFSTPIFLALKHGFYREQFEFLPYPSGSGHLIQGLNDGSIDVAIGLTEAFVRGIAGSSDEYRIVGTYVQSPLRWAISTGAQRSDITSCDQLEGKCCGVSRMGSGSDVMSRVLQHERGWSSSFSYAVKQTFANLRAGVNDKSCDFFMWEHFTTKKYWDSGEIKRIGEIYTPWPSWVLVAGGSVLASAAKSEVLKDVIAGINKGIEYFRAHEKEAIQYIAENLDYSEQDAISWLSTVQFSDDVGSIDPAVITKTLNTLKLAVDLPDHCDKRQFTATLAETS